MKGLTLRRIQEVTGGDFRLSFVNGDGSYGCVDAEGMPCQEGKLYEEGTDQSAVMESRAVPCGFADKAASGVKKALKELLDTEVSSIVTDSRKAGPGSLFGAIAGTRVDGNDFIPAVFRQGAVCVLTERTAGKKDLYGDKEPERAAGGFRAWIRVGNTVEALGRIAAEYLNVLKTPVVGITGSVGKTSTKEMIASVLSVKLRTLKTEGNFNNELGLPMTVFRLTPEDEAAVLEMGVSHFGDMTVLAKIAQPSVMVITNIGTCHLEFLQDRRGVFRAKTEVFDYLKKGAQVILNGNDDLLRQVKEAGGSAPLFFGVDSSLEGVSDLCAGSLVDYPGDLPKDRCVTVTSIRLLGFEGSECTISTPAGAFLVKVPVPGIHNCSNAAAATAVGLGFGMSLEQIREGIESARTISGRFKVVKAAGKTVIDDCYNANPVSMKSSLLVLSGAQGRRCAVLGDMGELGDQEHSLHEDVGKFAADCVDRLIAIGPLSRSLYEAAKKKDPGLSALWYPTVEEFLTDAGNVIREGDTVLVKASHFMHFERIVEALTE